MADSIPAQATETSADAAFLAWSTWRSQLLRAGIGLLTIFAGVTAAFFVDGYRQQLEARQQLDDTRSSLIVELKNYEASSNGFSDSIDRRIAHWTAEDAAGRKAVPGYLITTGSLRPPMAAWTSAVVSGEASHFDPRLQLRLGYFYSEFSGIHDNYVRRVEFAEKEIMPREVLGATAFYGPDGKLLPQFRVQMVLLSDFSQDLRRLTVQARRLRIALEAPSPR